MMSVITDVEELGVVAAQPSRLWDSVLHFPGASREVAILELFSDWSGKLKKWDGKLIMSFFWLTYT